MLKIYSRSDSQKKKKKKKNLEDTDQHKGKNRLISVKLWPVLLRFSKTVRA